MALLAFDFNITTPATAAALETAVAPVSASGSQVELSATTGPQVPLEAPPDSFVRLDGWSEGTEIIGKKPIFSGEFFLPVNPGNFTFILDNTDVTALVVLTGTRFVLQQPVMLNAGSHTLTILAIDSRDRQLQHKFTFTSRHTENYEEAYGNGAAAAVITTPLDKGNQTDYPDIQVNSSLRSEMKLRRGNTELGMKAGLRYLDQNIPLPYSGDPPALEKGLTLLDYQVTGKLGFTDGSLLLEFGNVTINETPNTILNLARRGGRAELVYKNLTVASFVVKGENVLGFRDGTGLSYDRNEQIAGGSAALSLLDNRVQVRAIYADGGEPLGSQGIAQADANRSGNVLGINLVTDYFQGRLRTEAEYVHSSYDPDSSDEFGEQSDKAWLLRASGLVNLYSYEIALEHFGREYASIGNQMQQRDHETLSARLGRIFNGVHSFNLVAATGHDNVDDDPLLPRYKDYQGQVDYAYTGLKNWPMGLGYRVSVNKTDSLPEGLPSLKMRADAVTGEIGYVAGQFNINLNGSYSYLDDQTNTDNDSTVINVSLVPAWASHQVSFTPHLSWNRSEQHLKDIWVDNYIASLDLRSNFLRGLLTFDATCSYTVTTDSEDTIDTRALINQMQLAYSLKDYFPDYFVPSLALRGTYVSNDDRVGDNKNDDFTLFLSLTSSVPFAF